MAQTESAVVYDGLPISSGGAHSLGRVRARSAFEAWFTFLGTRTEPSLLRGGFDFPVTPGLEVDPAVRRRIERAFPGDDDQCPVPWESAQDAVELFEAIQPLPVNEWGMGPVWLRFAADFRLRTPNSDVLWPGQDPRLFDGFTTPAGIRLGVSWSRLTLQAKPSIGLSLSIPNASDADVAQFVPWLQAALPMPLSRKHWTRWTRTNRGDSYRGRRLQLAS